MSRGGLAELAIGDGPAGEGAGGFLDVGLAVMADPQGEELHQLAGQVLVGVPLAVGRRVEPDQERGSRIVASRSSPNGLRARRRKVSF